VRPLTDDHGALDRLPSSEEDAVAAALIASKEVRRLESSLTARDLEVRSARATKLPRVDLVAQYGLFARFNNYEQFFRSFERHNGQVGVSVQVPIFAGSAARAREEQAEAEIAKLRAQLATTRNRISVAVRQAFQEVRKADAANEVARLDLDVARDLVSIQLAQMDEGRSSMEKLEEARFLENEKWIAFYDARWLLDRARLEVSRQTGTLIAALR
jgi:outer membrane protein TolC